MKFFKTWGPLMVAILALASSAYAIYQDNAHYQEVTKPHTQHDEIYNRLVILDNKIERIEKYLTSLQEYSQSDNESLGNLREAKELRDQAELAWDAGNYDEADNFISQAHIILEESATPTTFPTNWWLIGGVIAAIIIISAIVWIYLKGSRNHE